MIPILYESTEKNFISNGLGRLYDCISCKVTEERNGIYEVDFEYPVNGENFDKIQEGRIIACEHDCNNDVQPFDIVSHSKPINGIVKFHGVHISYRQSKIVVSGKNISTIKAAFAALKKGQPSNPFSYYTDKKAAAGFVAAFDGVPRSVRQILGGIEGSILDAYGGEYLFDRFNVNLLISRGETKSFPIRYGVNLLDYQDDTDFLEAYSACVPFWKGTNNNGVETIVKGGYITSGLSTYSGRDEAVPMDLTDKFESQPTKTQVEALARSLLKTKGVTLPNRSIKVNFINLADTEEFKNFAPLLNCSLCDTIPVFFPLYNVEGQFKIVKTVYDVLAEKYDELELGNLSTTLSDALGISTGLGQAENSEIIVPEVVQTTYTANDYVTEESFNRITVLRYGRLIVVEGNLRIDTEVPASAGTGGIGSIEIGRITLPHNVQQTARQTVPCATRGVLGVHISNAGIMTIYNYRTETAVGWARFNCTMVL